MQNILSNPTIVGTVAGVLVSVAMLPQLFKLIKSKKADDVSTGMLVILLFGVALWVYYGIIKKEVPIICTNAFSLLVNSVILALSIKYKRAKSS